MTVAAGTRLGPYEILSQIGAGGMGEVYRARDSRIGRDVALKLLLSPRDSDESALRRLELEARTAGSLNHPNLVTIYDVGVHEGAPYVVMELLKGDTLRVRLDAMRQLRTGSSAAPLSPRKVVDLASQIARGLAAAHEKGVVHRDLKPENIFVTLEGHVKIVDFGIAKFAAMHIAEDGDTETLETDAGKVIGTLGYMSPEQLQAAQVDHRSDIFSFGVVLYEMLAGKRPFRGNSTVETLSAILRDDPPPLNDVDDHISPALALVVRRCLEKAPAERFQSIRDVSFALEAATASTAPRTSALPDPPRPRVPGLVLLAALLLLASVAGIGAYAYLHRDPPVRDVHFAQLTFDEGLETQPGIAPDGSSFVYVSTTSGNSDIWLRRVGGDKATNLTIDCSEADEEPAFSPDGRWIAFRSERGGGGLFVMGATGESVRRMTDFGHSPAWSPDGKRIAFATEPITDPAARLTTSKLYAVDVESGAVSLLTKGDAVQPSWSPGGTRIAYWGLPTGTSERTIWTMPATGGTPTRVTNDRAMNWNPVWSPDGAFLYFASDRAGSMNIWRVSIDQTTGAVHGAPEAVTNSAFWCGYPSLTRDGHTIAFSTRANEGAVFRVPIDRAAMSLGKPVPVLQGSRRILSPVPSPDGTQVAISTLGVQEDVFVIGSDGSGLRQLTNDRFRDRAPRWTPDGSRLVFHSDRGGKYALWSIRTDGSGLQQVSPDPMMDGVFSPDGRWICALAEEGTTRRPVLIDMRAKAKAQPLPPVSKSDVFWPASFSPDGSQIVGLTLDDAGFESISTYSLATRSYRLVSKSARRAGWLDSHTILLIETDGAVRAYDLRNGSEKRLGQLPLFNWMRAPNVDASGTSLYYVSLPTEADVWAMDVRSE